MPDLEPWQTGGFGLYLHWPYCLAKCPYCDFNSHVAATVNVGDWREAYLREIARLGAETPGRVLSSIYFGGGTPSLMDPDLVDAVLTAIRSTWPLSNDAEITLEANPTSVEAGRFRAYHEAGVNRISMGIQALDDMALRALGRMHSVAEARAAFDIARDIFPRISFDLIYARQNQSAEDWRQELREALAMAADHLSLYQLSIEPGTAFGARFAAGKLRGLPDEDLSADLWEITQEMTAAAGFPAYEISNHARPGAEGRHNLIYWRQGDYLGIGPGAHGRVTLNGQRFATETPLSPAAWLAAAGHGTGESLRSALPRDEIRTERVMMGLRLTEGMALGDLAEDAGFGKRVTELVDSGHMWAEGDRIGVTARGRPLLNAVLRALLA